jgi:uncharacterized OB-fold protein
MREFIDYLKIGELRIPVCMSCGSKAWPPSRRCPHCLSRTALKKMQKIGILLEFSSSHVRGMEGVYGLIELSGIRLVGTFGTHHLVEGMKVRMTKCGVRPDDTVFYFFVPART